MKKLVNWAVQGPVVSRILWHLLAYNAATIMVLVATVVIERALGVHAAGAGGRGENGIWLYLRPMLLTLCVMLPIMAWELLVVTNRIAGPLFRYQKLLDNFVRSGTLSHAVLRDKDLTTDLQKSFNEFVDALHALYPETNPERGVAAPAAHTMAAPAPAANTPADPYTAPSGRATTETIS